MDKNIKGNPIEIKGTIPRQEIIKTVIGVFIDTENQFTNQGFKFFYPVEKLSNGQWLFILRPGFKANFDFKVEVLPEHNLGVGKHDDLTGDIATKKEENPEKYPVLFNAISDLVNCIENDVDVLLEKYSGLNTFFQEGASVEILLKVLKWLFIMEDIVYWNKRGRYMLYQDGISEI